MIWRYLDEQQVPEEALLQAFPVGRMGRPENCWQRRCICAPRRPASCTGTTLILDGGFTAQ